MKSCDQAERWTKKTPAWVRRPGRRQDVLDEVILWPSPARLNVTREVDQHGVSVDPEHVVVTLEEFGDELELRPRRWSSTRERALGAEHHIPAEPASVGDEGLSGKAEELAVRPNGERADGTARGTPVAGATDESALWRQERGKPLSLSSLREGSRGLWYSVEHLGDVAAHQS
jgi:hypothetical protein